MAVAPPADQAFQRALAALRAGNAKDAEHLFKAVLRTQPKHTGALNLLGVILTQRGEFGEAETCLRAALAENPRSDATLYNYGIILKALNRPAEALERFTQALAINPASAETWNNRGTIFNDLNRAEEAIADFEQATRINPQFAEAFCNKGKSLALGGRLDEAFLAYDRALAIKPDLAEAWYGRGSAFCARRNYDEAHAAFQKALALKPGLAEAWLGIGNICYEQRRDDDALAAYDKALALKPDSAEANLGRGNVFVDIKHYDDASAAYDRALALKPHLAEGWLGRGNVFAALQQYDDALTAYDRALVLKPDLAKAWLGRGNVFAGLQQYSEALAAYDRALALKADFAEAWVCRGKTLAQFDKHIEAYEACNEALKLRPDIEYAASLRLYEKLHMCDWTNLEAEESQLLLEMREQKRVTLPFPNLAIRSSAADQFEGVKRFVALDMPRFPPVWHGEIYSHDRIRVAYVSSDLRDHPVAYLTAGLFEHHDRSRFEVTAISLGAEQDSDFSRRLKKSFERFVDARSRSDLEVAELIRRLEIDIVVDLNGFTRNGRPGILARRPAPVQVNYLGYSGTMGAACYDYIVADPTVIPDRHFAFYSEKVVWLPESFLVNDAARAIADSTPARSALGLPETGFVFCCFNQSYKIHPAIFGIWMRLLKATDGSVLWLREYDAAAVRNLCLEAERRGVAPARLVFAPPVPLVAEHLARQRQADLFLDTLPYNAHTTASDALWAGLPVVTCLGETFAGRVAGSLDRAVGLPELVTDSLADYEALALKIAREPALCATLKATLARNRDNFPLFDTARFARHIEAAYARMSEAQRHSHPPAHFAVTTGDQPIRTSFAP